MEQFWLTKKTLIEALKLSEGMPQTTMIQFKGSSEVKNGIEYTVVDINARGKKKVVKEPFQKLLLSNNDAL